MHGLEMHLMFYLKWILDLYLHMRALFKAFCYIEAIKSFRGLSYPNYVVPLLSGQPLLCDHFLKSRGWPLNRGRTVLVLLFQKRLSEFFLLLSSFGKKDKMQLLAMFKNILYIRFRATLSFRKFKVALNPMYRIFLNFAKSCMLSCLWKFDSKKK